MYIYKNGNTEVILLEDGTKIRHWPDDEIPTPIYPESCDVKITGYCDNPICKKWCHEKSNLDGKHADLNLGINLFRNVPKGVEMAIGGGNPLSHPDLVDFLKELRKKDIVPNLTVNQYHINQRNLIEKLIKDKLIFGLGISLISKNYDDMVYLYDYPHKVFHLILGIHKPDDLHKLIEKFKDVKVLLLGYKNYGMGESFKISHNALVENNIKLWYNDIFNFRNLISFDNLALEQLNVENRVSKKLWQQNYMGDDGQFTMFVDLVEKQFTKSSTNKKRIDIHPNDVIEDLFSKVRNGEFNENN